MTVKPKPTPVEPRTISQKDIVGTYELRIGTIAKRWVFLDNNVFEPYSNGTKSSREYKWSLVDKEVHIVPVDGLTSPVYRINLDSSLTWIGGISKGIRTDTPKEKQITFKKITQTTPTRQLTPEEKKVVGIYQSLDLVNNKTLINYRMVLYGDGLARTFANDGESPLRKWRIVDGEIYVFDHPKSGDVYRINPDRSLTSVRHLSGMGGFQRTFKKIK